MPALDAALELFWHPVATVAEVRSSAPRPLAVTLLGRRIAVALLGDERPMAVADRCVHRSTRLSVGSTESDGIRCAYHGWKWAPDGRCVEIPAMPTGPIPAKACVDVFDATVAYGLVWVCVSPPAVAPVPACPGWDDPSLRVLAGDPYTWPTGAARRVENFVDLAHFAFVHDGTLGQREEPVPELPTVQREGGELRFGYEPPTLVVDDEAMFGSSWYRMPMPLTVDIEFRRADGARRRLWMTASPVEAGLCRSFWLIGRDDDLDPTHDEDHMAFQRLVLSQDEPVVCNQDPPELPLEPGAEVSVRTDRVSIEYRRWLRDLAAAASAGREAVKRTVEGAPVAALGAQRGG